jgi:Alpha/beta hydrolase
MANGLGGLDPNAADALARSFMSSSQQLVRSEAAIRYAMYQAWWAGPAANAFRNQWDNGLAAHLRQASQLLTQASTTVTKNLREQIAASSTGVTIAPVEVGTIEFVAVTAVTGAFSAIPGISAGSNVATVAAAWAALTPAQRAELIALSPERIGNLDGIPPADRIAANRIQMERDLANGTGDTALLKNLLDSNSQVILYRPADGQIAIVHGNIATANTVIVTVPGTGTHMGDYGVGSTENRRALELQQRAQQISGQDVAVVAWLGYHAPQWNIAENPGKASMAIDGGVSLASFGAGLGITGDQRLTVVGHSYGSTVVGYGVRDGLAADNIIVMGSPGMSVNNVGDLNAKPGAEVFAMRNTLDPVGGLNAFGTEPTSLAFGAQRLATVSDGIFTHSDYWTHDNLNQIALAATDGKPNVVYGPQSVGEAFVAPQQLISGYVNNGIDQVQKFIPTPLDGFIDDTQHVSQTLAGAVNTFTTEKVDIAVGGLKKVGGAAVRAAQETGEALTNAAVTGGKALSHGAEAVGSAVADAGGAVLHTGGKAVGDLVDWLSGDDE